MKLLLSDSFFITSPVLLIAAIVALKHSGISRNLFCSAIFCLVYNIVK